MLGPSESLRLLFIQNIPWLKLNTRNLPQTALGLKVDGHVLIWCGYNRSGIYVVRIINVGIAQCCPWGGTSRKDLWLN